MDAVPLLPLVIRWLHLISFSLALGVPLFVRLVLQPAAGQVLDADTRARLLERINATWRMVVYTLITVLILTGLYNYLAVAIPMIRPWPADYKAMYHGVIGFKLLLAFVVFVLASALPGRTAVLAPIRARGRLFLGVMIVLVLVILGLSNTLRSLRDTGLKQYGSPTTQLTRPA